MWKNVRPASNALSEEIEELDADLNIADWLQSFSKRGPEVSEVDLNSWFEAIEEAKQMMSDKKILKKESLVEILELPILMLK